MLEFRNVSLSYSESKKERKVLDDISFKFPNKGLIGICGISGSGKTTILNIINCIIKPTKGTYLVNNKDVYSYEKEEFEALKNNYFSYVYQENNLINDISVFENLELVCISHNNKRIDKIDYYLKLLKIEYIKDELAKNLSGGEIKRVMLARSLLSGAKVLLLDEVTSGLDYENSINVMEALKDISKSSLQP